MPGGEIPREPSTRAAPQGRYIELLDEAQDLGSGAVAALDFREGGALLGPERGRIVLGQERLDHRQEGERILAGHDVPDDTQAVDERCAVIIEAADEVAVAGGGIDATETRHLDHAGVHEGSLERRIWSRFVPGFQEMARIVAAGLEVALELHRGPLAPRGDGREAVETRNVREDAARRFT